MNSWNNATAPAYNLKIYNVIDNNLQDSVYDLMQADDFYDEINYMISDFDRDNDYTWQAGFTGRSNGYLVLYRGGKRPSDYKSYCTNCYQRNFKTVEETGNNTCGRCGESKRVNQVFYDTYTNPGQSIEDNEVPADVLKAFRKLAINIVKHVEYLAKNFSIEEEEYQVTETRKVLRG